VIIATDRAKRPSDFVRESPKQSSAFCPFCFGNEAKTPPEILAYRSDGSAPNTSGWTVRVVPNKFPALGIEGDLGRKGEGLFDKMNGIGAHEVIIESPDHNSTLASLPEKRVEDVVWAFRDRVIDLKKDRRFRYVLIFKNHGEAAGASLEHPHTQLIALPIVPKRVQEEVDGSRQYYSIKERCIFCDMIRQELDSKIRVVDENNDFVTIEPYAPRFPFETWILPKSHESHFENCQTQLYQNLALALKTLVARMEKVLESPAYNLVIHTSPMLEASNDYYHWHVELMPRLTRVAGFEWGTGFYINPTPPEEAAKFLREAEL
jgi:UDPglucose--hexose-1-phosphate uridylyltransferase